MVGETLQPEYPVHVEIWVVPGDIDGDDLPDLYVSNNNGPSSLWRNHGDFCFEDMTERSKVEVTHSYGGAFFDLDNDGDRDLLATTPHVDLFIEGLLDPMLDVDMRRPGLIVFENDGTGVFTDVTDLWGFSQAEFIDPTIYLGVDALDLNGDGVLDVMPRVHVSDSESPVVYFSQPDGQWTLEQEPFGTVRGEIYGIRQTDVDGDDVNDLMLALLCSPERPDTVPALLQGTAGGWVEPVPAPDLFGDAANCEGLMGAAAGDYDEDGRVDYLFSSNSGPYLAHNMGDFVFEVDNLALGQISHAPGFLDYDNDGWLDFILPGMIDQAHPEPQSMILWRNVGGTFEDQSALVVQDSPRIHPHLSMSDLDRDGDVDLVLSSGDGVPRLLRNDVATHPSITVTLEGVQSNREGIGARLEARMGDRLLVREVYAGGNSGGSNELAVVFGLGENKRLDELVIRWPTGERQVVGPVDEDLRVVEP